jgi:hypothetical protein
MKFSQRDFDRALNRFEERVDKACKDAGHKQMCVDYSAYNDDAAGIPIDNLDEITIQGKAILVSDKSATWVGTGGRHFRSVHVVERSE